MKEILQVKDIEKYYGNKGNVTKAINNISFNVEEGEFVGIMGPSGSGKTTLLNCISTVDNVTTGNIKINGKEITKLKSKSIEKFRREELGFIFQDFNLLDTLTAFENIALALTIQEGKKVKNIRERVLEVARKLDIEEVLSKFPYEMSGGQKQRVAAARAIITNPSLILADEPTGALDSKASRLLLDSFEKLNEEMKATILMVTHDAFTASYAQRILFIKDGRVFNELIRGNDSRKEFFNRIIEVVTLLGGDTNNVF
ncbi:ABC transporter ATP-binding protein [Clostridium paraputrificum]|uniref:ABC transporter ATP-binding protein n=1 Tax=Clostridium paraputrificum TaxID=29363 RepID=UPI0006C01D42|nr:ABC transporter ATP-binding protein [Clostridium paraputrificum]CUO52020.1 ABC transporter [Clostridium paraputrificum]